MDRRTIFIGSFLISCVIIMIIGFIRSLFSWVIIPPLTLLCCYCISRLIPKTCHLIGEKKNELDLWFIHQWNRIDEKVVKVVKKDIVEERQLTKGDLLTEVPQTKD